MAIVWNPSMSTGIPVLDRHHRQMIDTVNALGRRLMNVASPVQRSELSSVLAGLEVYSCEHFSFEEQCMSVLRCPAAASNRAAHGSFREAVAGFGARLTADEPAGPLAVEVEAFLSRWLLEHICGIDSRLIHCARKHATA